MYERFFFSDSKPEVLATFYNQILRPGQALTLTCAARGVPVPRLEWTRDGEPVRPDNGTALATARADDLAEDDGDSAASVLLKLTLSDAPAGWYGCRATNHLGWSERSRRVDVVGPAAAGGVPDRAAAAGSDVWLRCPYGGHPVRHVRWYKRGEALEAK